MKYEITLNDKTTKTIHADSLLDAEIYALCMYKDKVFGSVIKSLESDDVLWLPVLSYYIRSHWEFSGAYAAEMEKDILIMIKENRLEQNDPTVGISEEQKKELYHRYTLFQIWQDENWDD